jgi:hypothetical protein
MLFLFTGLQVSFYCEKKCKRERRKNENYHVFLTGAIQQNGDVLFFPNFIHLQPVLST